MKASVRVNGEPSDVEVHLDVDRLTMQQAVRLEQVIGADRCSKLLMGNRQVATLPSVLRGLIFVQLQDQFSDIDVEGFDLTLDEIAEDDAAVDLEADDVAIPMSLPDGTTIDGAVEHVDPTRLPA